MDVRGFGGGWLVGLGVALAACATATGPESGQPSASSGDAGAGVSADAGSPPDAAGEVDAMAADAAVEAAGPVRVDVPATPCEDSVDAAYVTPAGLPPMTDARRGDVVRCAPDQGYDVAAAQAAIAGKGITMTATSGAKVYRVLYRTTRGDGSPGVSSARVYLPTVPRALPLPVIVVGHPSEGIADGCAPSKSATSNQDLALPWAALGYAVIVPDYAGLGTDGVQGYLDNHDQGYSLLDGARALRRLVAAGAFSPKIALFGYSQGGGAALSGQALAKSYGADGDVAAVVAFAPQWPTRMNSFGYVSMLRNPTGLTIGTGISKSAIVAVREYAYFGNQPGAGPGDGYPAAKRDALAGAANTLCLVPLGGFIQASEPKLGDLIDDTLRTSLLACIDGTPGCMEPGASYHRFLSDNILRADPTGAPILMVQGLADQIMLPAEEAACTLDKLVAEGITPDVCADLAATHASVLSRNVMTGIAWVRAKLDGTATPSCSSVGMPSCTP